MQEYTPFEGGAHGMLDQEGLYKVRIDSIEPGVSNSGKGMVKVGCTTLDQDVSPNTPLISRVIYSGVDTNGNFMVRQFCDFMHSTGTPVDNIRQFGQANEVMNIEQACGQLIGREAYIEARFGEYNGRLTTEIANWIAKDRYDKQSSVGAHRGMRKEQADLASMIKAKAGKEGATASAGAPPQAPGAQPNLGGPAAMQPQAAPPVQQPAAQPAVVAPQPGTGMVPRL
jgi:hypothetical protein